MTDILFLLTYFYKEILDSMLLFHWPSFGIDLADLDLNLTEDDV